MQMFGKAAIYGVGLRLLYWGISIPGQIINIDGNFSDLFDTAYLRNKYGDVVGAKVTNTRGECVISFIPVGSSNHNTISAAYSSAILPSPFSVVQLSDCPGIISGYWNYQGSGTIRMSNQNYTIMTLPLIRFDSIAARQLATILQKA